MLAARSYWPLGRRIQCQRTPSVLRACRSRWTSHCGAGGSLRWSRAIRCVRKVGPLEGLAVFAASMGEQYESVLSVSIRKRIIFDATMGGRYGWALAMRNLWDEDSNDVDAMLRACTAVENEYWGRVSGFRQAPAPFYFLRAAILCRKHRDYSGELAICERWARLLVSYDSQEEVEKGRAVRLNASATSRKILARLPKARQLSCDPEKK